MARKARKTKSKPAKKKKKTVATARRKVTKRKVAKAAKRTPAKRGKAKAPAKRKTVRAAKPAKARKAASPAKKKEVFGEGNYTATRNFDKAEAKFVKRNKAKIPAMGKAAEKALDGPQGDELRAAEREAAGHSASGGEE